MQNQDFIFIVFVGILVFFGCIYLCLMGNNTTKITRGRRSSRGSSDYQAITVTQVTSAGPGRIRIPLRDSDQDILDEDGFVLIPEPDDAGRPIKSALAGQ